MKLKQPIDKLKETRENRRLVINVDDVILPRLVLRGLYMVTSY